MIKQGIDISHWNVVENWSKIKASGIDFIIIKLGGSDGGYYKDSQFDRYYLEAKAHGFLVGAYYFAGKQFITTVNGRDDARHALEILGDKKLDLPLFIDVEATSPSDKVGATNATIAFCDSIANAGIPTGVYASKVSGFISRLDDSKLTHLIHWVAQYNYKCDYVGEYSFWQKSDKGHIDGIKGYVDLDEFYDDVVVKTVDELAHEVINGMWGNGDERKRRLTEAGYNYRAVQDRVNKILLG